MNGDALSLISDGLAEVKEGCKLPVRMKSTGEWTKAEVVAIKSQIGGPVYYVHFVDYNKRLDEWVTEDRLDTRRVEPPHSATSATNTGVHTPKLVGPGSTSKASSVTTSRPASPVTPAVTPSTSDPPSTQATPSTSASDITGPGVLQHAILKAERKKKQKSAPSVCNSEEEDGEGGEG